VQNALIEMTEALGLTWVLRGFTMLDDEITLNYLDPALHQEKSFCRLLVSRKATSRKFFGRLDQPP
jgi:hypothetical protein